MKIAILSTPVVALPPKGYAGIERVVSTLEQGLVAKGHDVTVYATGDSKVSSKLQYYYAHALQPSVKFTYNPYYFLNHVYHFFSLLAKEQFDIVHLQDAGRLSLYFVRDLPMPFVTTLHGSYEKKENDCYGIQEEKRNQLELFKQYPFISISNAQRVALPNINYIGTVYNGIHISSYPYVQQGEEYIVWLGRVTNAKGLDTAIHIAKATNKRLEAYGFVDSGEQQYYQDVIEPLLGEYSAAIFHGEINNDKKKVAVLGNAKVFILPFQWDEPFGLVMVESMACGTPVIAYARGSVPEIIKDGETGFIVNPSDNDIRGDFIIKKTGIAGLQEAVERIYRMSPEEYQQMRKACRLHIEENFTVEKMVDGYEQLYQKVINDTQ